MSARRFVFALLFVALVNAPPPAHAQTSENRSILVLLKTVPGAPTPAEVVDYINTLPHSATPPLQSFTVADPVAGGYLLPDRASGDFLIWLNNNPNSARKKLEDALLPTFASPADIPQALAALRADPYVEWADVPLEADFHVTPSNVAGHEPVLSPLGSAQYGRDALEIDAAWQITGGGYAMIAQIDAGLATTHPNLQQFAGTNYVGGPFVAGASKDVGLTGQPSQPGFDSTNVDEAKLGWIGTGQCTPVSALLPPAHLGHGTHVAGLLGANGASNQSVQGTCKGCSIAAYRAVYLECNAQISPPQVLLSFNNPASYRAEVESVDGGAQAMSLSYGASAAAAGITYCLGHSTFPPCLALAHAKSRDAVVTASAGNDRTNLDFPASDPRVIAVGGFQNTGDLAIWDESPGGTTNCPTAPLLPLGRECGTNRTILSAANGYNRQELMGSAKSVLSTVYPNNNYVDYAQCGDSYGTPNGDGVGWCTGTSMSAPQIAGAIGVLRSVNPLVPTSEPEPAAGIAPGLRTVLAETTHQTQAGQPWNAYTGYGIPDVATAARKMLGRVAGVTVRNRATPLFRLYNAYAKDFAETTSPQYALSWMIAQVHKYTQPVSGLGAQLPVPGYKFPYDHPNDGDDTYESEPATPLAAMYVLTTGVRPRSEWPALLPLRLMEKPKPGGRDTLLVTTVAHIEAAHAAGYQLLSQQGFVFAPCTPEPACIPPDAEPIYRACKTADNDCATFLESERADFEAAGYLSAYPAGSDKKLGYAYSATDTDQDGLPDGFERVVGTNSALKDSDGDGSLDKSDSQEFPLAGIAVGDPCAGGSGARDCPANVIFEDGYDGF